MKKQCHYCEAYSELPTQSGCGQCDNAQDRLINLGYPASSVTVKGTDKACTDDFEPTAEFMDLEEQEYEEQLRDSYAQKPKPKYYKQHEL